MIQARWWCPRCLQLGKFCRLLGRCACRARVSGLASRYVATGTRPRERTFFKSSTVTNGSALMPHAQLRFVVNHAKTSWSCSSALLLLMSTIILVGCCISPVAASAKQRSRKSLQHEGLLLPIMSPVPNLSCQSPLLSHTIVQKDSRKNKEK